jgi:TonB-dependent starch-binding outer membrane protein SusC
MKKLKPTLSKIAFALSLLMISSGVFAQFRIQGQVTDESNRPVAGATVVEEGTTNGVITDTNGNYSISVKNPNAALVFSFIGMKREIMQVDNRTVIDVVLQPESMEIEEVVAIGYGTIRKSDVTGSVASINATEEDKLGNPSLIELLQGKAAGVLLNSSNVAGESRSIRIRGTSSINSSSEPLYVVDGFPILNGGTRAGSGINDLSIIANIDPNSIESIEVLKDASAAAIYGSQGANGVIIITTKKATGGNFVVDMKVNSGVMLLEENFRSMDSYEYAYYVRNVITNKYPFNHDKVPTDPSDWGTRFYYIDEWKDAHTTDWIDVVTRTGKFQDYSLAMRGGTDQGNFSATLGYVNNKGIVDFTDFSRFSADITTQIKPTDRITFTGITKLSFIDNDGVITQSNPDQVVNPTGAVLGALSFDPTIEYDPDDLSQYFVLPNGAKIISPAVNLAEQTRNSRRFDAWASGGMRVYLDNNEKVYFDSKVSGRYLGNKNNSFDSKFTYAGMNWGGENGGIADVRNEFTLFGMWNNILGYTDQFGKHSFGAILGQEYQYNIWEGQGQRSINFRIDQLGTYNLAMADANSHDVPNTWAGQWTILSYFGRMNYAYDDRYLLTLTYRADGSSRFSKNNKWGYFPSSAVAWRLSEEEFMESISGVLNDAKIRFGWGVTGNQSIGAYESQALMGTSSAYYPEGTQTMALRPERLANDDLKWETTTQTNIGMDLSFFNSRLNITADVYQKITKDLLMSLPIPPSSGFDRITTNVGQISNKGFELEMSSVNISKNDFSWRTMFNFARNVNNVDDLGDKGEIFQGKTSYQEIIREGEPLGQWYGLLTDGLWTQEDLTFTRDEGGTVIMTVIPGRERPTLAGEVLRFGSVKFVDVSGPDSIPDGVINDFDRVIVARSQPKFFGGLTNTFRYKNLSLRIFCDYSYGKQVYNHMKQNFVAVSEAYNHYSVDYYFPTQYELIKNDEGLYVEDQTKVINPGNPDGKYPINATRSAGLSGYVLDMFVEDASYFRIKEATFSYNLPLKRLIGTINSCQIHLKASNLYTFTKYSGYDPASIGGRDWNPYPRSRTVQLGLNLSF